MFARPMFCLFETMETRLAFSAGSLDPSFGVGGRVSLPGGPVGNTAALEMPIAVDAQGRTLVASDYFAGHFTAAVVTRLNTDGTIDKSFGNNGTFVDPNPPPTSGFTPGSQYVRKIVVASDGSILLFGQNIQKLTSAGKFDTTFHQTVGVSFESTGVVLGNGTILTADDRTGTLTRYTAGGALDTGYGVAGGYTIGQQFKAVAVADVELDSAGRPVVSLVVQKADSSVYLGTARLTPAGLLDVSYGVNGYALSPAALAGVTGVADLSAPIAVGGDGSVYQLLLGKTDVWGYFNNGKAVTDAAATLPGNGGAFSDIAVQSDGKLIVVGSGEVTTSPDVGLDVAVVDRFMPITSTTAALTFDPGFDGDGSVFSVAGPNVGRSVVVDGQGRVVATGASETGSPDGVLRILTTGPTANPPVALKGTVIGTAGSYQNSGNTAAKAFDGNLNTYFDAPGPDNNYVGLDLGKPQPIARISYAPRGGWAGYAARMVGGVFQGSDSADFSSGVQNLYTVTTAPAAGVLTTVGVGGLGTFRYVRYLAPAGSYGNVAEILFARSPQTLPGTPIGTPGSYRNQGNTIANAFDGDVSTYFDAPTATGSWVGIDLGTPTKVTQVAFAPRSRYESRMVGGVLQASSTADFSSDVHAVYMITTAPPAGALTTATTTDVGAFRYWRYLGPADGQCDVAEVVFEG